MPIDIINKLQVTPSTNEKLQILNENSGNELLKRVIVAALDPNINYFIKKIPEFECNGNEDIEFFLNNISILSERGVTGHAAIKHLSGVLSALTPESAELAIKIIRRDLRCGVQESTVNKVWKDLIPEFPCMLAQPSKDKFLKNIKYPAYSQKKADGARINLICINGEVSPYTRSGKTIPLYGKIIDEFRMMADYCGGQCVFDGELCMVIDGKLLDRKTGNGMINTLIQGPNRAQKLEDEIWTLQKRLKELRPEG